MESQRVDKLKRILEAFRNSVDEQVAVKLELEKCNRIIERLSSFSSECKECYQHFIELENHINTLDPLVENNFKDHQKIIEDISSHLQKQHKLLSSGYYLSTYMAIGSSLGLLFGLLIFDNIALGLPLGMGIGVAVGAGLDADVNKKGMTL